MTPSLRAMTDVVTRIVLVRHGESQVSVSRRVGGPRTCSGLSPLGVVQAERLRDRLRTTGEVVPDAIYTSAYPRAQETAAIIAAAFAGSTVVVEPGWGEHDPGPDCDGLTYEEFVERHGSPDWESDPHGTTFPGGETVAAFQHRVGVTLRAALDRHPGQTILVACHGGVVDTVLRTALRTPQTGGFELHTTNASLTEVVLVRPGRWRLLRYNDAAHLAGLPVASPREPVADGTT